MGEGRDVFSARNVLRRWAVGAALALLALTATARVTDRTAELLWATTGNLAQGRMGTGGSMAGKTFANAPGGIGAYMKGQKALPWPGKAQAFAMAEWKLLASPVNMAKAIISPGTIAAMIVGGAAAVLVDQACIRVLGGSMQLAPGMQWEQCTFGTVTGYEYRAYWNASSTYFFEDRAGACNEMVALYSADPYNIQQGIKATVNSVTDTGGTFGVGVCRYNVVRTSDNVVVTQNSVSFNRRQATKEDQTGWSPVSDEVAQQKLADKIVQACGSNAVECNRVLEEITGMGLPVETTDTPEVTGPATQEAGTKTETKQSVDAQGNPITTTTTTTTTYNFNYDGDKVTKTETTTTTVTVTNNTTNESTTQTETETKEDDRDKCAVNPDSLDCQELDVPDGEVPRSSQVLTYAAEALGFSGGSCPADIVKTYRGQAVTVFSYAKGCELLEDYVKPLVLMLSAWIAFIILMPGKTE